MIAGADLDYPAGLKDTIVAMLPGACLVALVAFLTSFAGELLSSDPLP